MRENVTLKTVRMHAAIILQKQNRGSVRGF
jgi:hypothetical protein